MGKLKEETESNARRSSGRIRKPTAKLRTDNDIKVPKPKCQTQVEQKSKTDNLSETLQTTATIGASPAKILRSKVARKVNADISEMCSPTDESKHTVDKEHSFQNALKTRNIKMIQGNKNKPNLNPNSEKSASIPVVVDVSQANVVGKKEEKVVATKKVILEAEFLVHEERKGSTRSEFENSDIAKTDSSSRNSHHQNEDLNYPQENNMTSKSSMKDCDASINDNNKTDSDENCDMSRPVLNEVEMEDRRKSKGLNNGRDKCTNTEYELAGDALKDDEDFYDDVDQEITDHERPGLKLDGSVEEIEEIGDDTDTTVLKCKVCSKEFNNRPGLTKHMMLHADTKPYQCEFCGLSFALKSYLTIHKVIHNGVRSHKCETCGKTFLRRTNLTSHMKTHSDSKTFLCDICNQSFKTKCGRDGHMKMKHTGGFVCHRCGKSYSHQNYLKKHLSLHAGEKPFECTECGKCFPYNQSLQEHMRRHLGEKPEVCDQCGKRFNNKRELKQHVKYHKTTAGFPCSECNMYFTSQSSLNKHMSKTHKKQHSCRYCNESFVNKKHLKSHVFNQHRDISNPRLAEVDLAKVKKVECSICQKVFFNRYVLSKHLVSMHQLSAKDVKAMLQIRKKSVSKPVAGKVLDEFDNDNDQVADKDFQVSLDNDKSFQVYYKDDEMAVYVKRVEDLDSKVNKQAKGGSGKVDGGSFNNSEARYIVVEGESFNKNELAGMEMGSNQQVTYEKIAADENDTAAVKAMVEATSGVDDTNTGAVQMEYVTTDHYDENIENSYVVISDPNEHSTSSNTIQEQVINGTEMYEISDNGSERIVLILNEASGDNSEIIFDGSEQYEIVESHGDIETLTATAVGHASEMTAASVGNSGEMIATPLGHAGTITAMGDTCSNEDIVEMDLGNYPNVVNDFEVVSNAPVISNKYPEVVLGEISEVSAHVPVTECNLVKIMKETAKTQESVLEEVCDQRDRGSVVVSESGLVQAIRSISETTTEINTSSDQTFDIQKHVPTHLQFAEPESESIAVDEHNDISNESQNSNTRSNFDNGHTSTTGTDLVTELACHGNSSGTVAMVTEFGRHGNTSGTVAMETSESCLSILPKSNSSDEFSRFEDALKTKYGDFKNNTEYNEFLDKMIQTIQHAKQSSFK